MAGGLAYGMAFAFSNASTFWSIEKVRLKSTNVVEADCVGSLLLASTLF